MTLADLAGYKGEWVEPAASTYHGFDVLELPPPSQSWATVEMLNILEACVPKWAPGQTLATLGPANAKYRHLLVEAKKRAYADLYRTTLTRTSFQSLLPGSSRNRMPRRFAARSIPTALRAPVPGKTPTAPATRSFFRQPTATETWCRG
jgi:hypothetical protein